MLIEHIWGQFCKMFPDMVKGVKSYKKVGSKTIMLTMLSGLKLFFIYDKDTNWSLGTKQWRTRPDQIPKNQPHTGATYKSLDGKELVFAIGGNNASGCGGSGTSSAEPLHIVKESN